MKVRGDEHFSPRLAAALRETALTPSWELTTVNDVGHAGSSDVHWATAFARESGNAIITGDCDFHTKPAQIAAVRGTGLKVIMMPAKWCNARMHDKLALLARWWPRIERQLAAMKPGEVYMVPFEWGDGAALKKIAVAYQKLDKKAKKAARRS